MMVSTDWLTWFGLIRDVTIFRLAPWTPSRLALPRKRGKKLNILHTILRSTFCSCFNILLIHQCFTVIILSPV